MNKKILYLLISVLLVPIFSMAAGRIAEIWTQPAVFKADEQVTFYFDVTGTDLADITEDIYLWSWFPTEPDAGNGANSSDFAKLTQVNGNVWKITMTPTEYYGVGASQITAFYGLLKTKNFSKASNAFAPDQDPANDIRIYDLSTIKGEAILDFKPKQFTLDRPLSVLLNANNTFPDQCGDNPIKGELANAPNVHVHSGVNTWSIVVENNAANVNKTGLTHLGDGIYRWDFIPNEYFGLAEGFAVTNISAVFASNNWAFIGKNVNCTDFFIDAPVIPDIPIPDLVFFPSKISKKDILSIIRTDNEPYVSALNYTITAGSKILTGSFTGTNKTFTAYINLPDELKEVGTLDKIQIEIKDNTGRIVSKNDMPLVQLTD